MRQKPGTKQSPGEKIVKDILRATRKQFSVVRDFVTDCSLI
ncbi:hypothetical protein SAMN05421764_10513 [Donghicola eburneus]|uniref:Pputative transposase IS3/IS911 n=1 Tax=Donghicola eburneus TaxID=393278 RepID=A0A1M4MZX3_9RHOB|nr:pputative transposase IS3/IS911 [Donghicola eburneus]SFQ51273.1 hypothetical protein SAMN05421764_10513 [Donghicola eburneus]